MSLFSTPLQTAVGASAPCIKCAGNHSSLTTFPCMLDHRPVSLISPKGMAGWPPQINVLPQLRCLIKASHTLLFQFVYKMMM